MEGHFFLGEAPGATPVYAVDRGGTIPTLARS